mmetsp:Transcript_91836/g.196808  ORF Transcript_91836/g.196808 Transcript_91836/m.196808 type:complete len:217 (+) Transcript_91836:479-1129(+)
MGSVVTCSTSRRRFALASSPSATGALLCPSSRLACPLDDPGGHCLRRSASQRRPLPPTLRPSTVWAWRAALLLEGRIGAPLFAKLGPTSRRRQPCGSWTTSWSERTGSACTRSSAAVQTCSRTRTPNSRRTSVGASYLLTTSTGLWRTPACHERRRKPLVAGSSGATWHISSSTTSRRCAGRLSEHTTTRHSGAWTRPSCAAGSVAKRATPWWMRR